MLTNFLRNGSSVVDGAKGSNSNVSYMKDSSLSGTLNLDSLIIEEVCHFVLFKVLRDNLFTLIAATFLLFSVNIMH